MKVVVTGAAGFIGSNVVDALLREGASVVGVDNFSTGERTFLDGALANGRFSLVEADLLTAELAAVFEGADAVIHLAANADVRFGWDSPTRDIEQNLLATQRVLEGMRAVGVDRLLFSSTGSVYGEAEVIPTPEDCPIPMQTSLYGASKFAAEGLIGAYAEGAGISGSVFRFVSVMGPRYTHGHVVDFLRQLLADPTRLRVLGDGTQRKSYMHVDDCVAGVLSRLTERPKFEVFNLGFDGYCTVNQSIGWISERLGIEPVLEYSGGDRGWVGDNPFIYLDTSRMRSTGWTTRHTIREAVEATVDYLVDNRWVVDRVEQRP